MAALPKRESTRRKAKESVRKNTQQIMAAGDDEDDIADIDLEDSDDDATWTPFKGKEAISRVEDIDDDDDEPEGYYENTAAAASGFRRVSASDVPPPTQLVPDGREFGVGDFMVLKNDAARDSAPIWR